MKTLTIEESEALLDLTQHPGRSPLLAVMELLVQNQERAVLAYDLGSGNVQSLLNLKSQAEGARKLLFAVTSHLEQIRQGASPTKREGRTKRESN